jgi:hypothetical protein
MNRSPKEVTSEPQVERHEDSREGVVVQGSVVQAPSSALKSKAPNDEKDEKDRSALGSHDVLLGRGLGTYNHVGNVKFRQLVNEHKLRYVACSKTDKPKIAKELVRFWRNLEPPGRFLARDEECKKNSPKILHGSRWYEVGDKKAQEKASQCLRERTPDVKPYYNYMRACRKEQKARALAAEILEMRNSTVPIQYLREFEREMQDSSTAVPMDFLLQQQIQQRQEANSLMSQMPRANSTLSQLQTSQLMSSQPRNSNRVLPGELLLQQREREAFAQMRASRAVEMEYLLRAEREREERALTAQILQNRASLMSPRHQQDMSRSLAQGPRLTQVPAPEPSALLRQGMAPPSMLTPTLSGGSMANMPKQAPMQSWMQLGAQQRMNYGMFR